MTTIDAITLAYELASGDSDMPTPCAVAWLRAGMRRYLRGEASTLEVALRLTGANRVAARNAALLKAARMIEDGDYMSTWSLAGKLHDAVTRFETVIAPRLYRNPETPLCPIDQAIQAARQSGARPLQSRRRLFDLLTNLH